MDGVGDIDRPRMRRRSARIGDNAFAEAVRVPGFHRRPLVGRREGGQDGVARVDLGEIAVDDLRFVSLRLASEISPHRIDSLPTDLANERYRAAAVLLRIRRPGEIHAAHTPTVRTVEESSR